MTLEGEQVDFNELQAQISLSLGTIRDMTSSWQNTSSKASNSTKQDDLREWMSRPSRLGLGASVAQTSASEIDVRLQRKLASKGPSVGNKVEEQSEQSDDEESKYRTTTKKTKNTAKKYLDKPHAVKKNVVGVDSNIQLSKKQRKKLNKKLKQQQQQQTS